MRRRVMLAAVAAALAAPLAPAVSAAPAGAPCDVVGFSPAFVRDRTVFCASYAADVNGFVLYRSTDAGRTWNARSRYVPVTQSDDRPVPTGIVVDPFFAETRTVYVLAGDGLYRAEQDGAGITRVSGSPRVYPGLVTPYVDGVPGLVASRRVAFATAPVAWVGTWRYDSALRTVVNSVGGPTNNFRFFIPPDYAEHRQAYALAHDVETDGSDVAVTDLAVFACDPSFTCTDKVQSFGLKVTPHQRDSLPGGVEWMVMSQDFTDGDRPGPQHGDYVVISRDGGRSWQPWTSLTALLPPEARDGRLPFTALHVTASPDAPHRYLAHLVMDEKLRRSAPKVPASQLFRSDDAGKTWRRIGYSMAPDQPGKDRGTLPWNEAAGAVAATGSQTFALPGGRVYLLAAHSPRRGLVDYRGLYCSLDFGRTWRRGGGC